MRAKIRVKTLIHGITLMFSLFFCLNTASPDGLIIIERPPAPPDFSTHAVPPPVPLTVKYHRVRVQIDNQVAVTSIDQVFKNEYDVDLEGTYIFPLPGDASITDFAMYIDGTRISGEILDKDEARKVYEDIVRRMKDPGLLEYVGRNMFRARVYPVPKHGETRIEIKYTQTLKYVSGICKYVYPLNTERFSPKPLEEVTISAEVKSKVPIKSIYSPSHRVDIIMKQFQADVSYEEKHVKPDRDFILYYTVSEKDLGLNLLCYKNPAEDGYFLMLLSPGQLEGRTINKDIIFVLDTSGSMNGDKIRQAKDALRFCINNLRKGDRFNVIGFATGVIPYKHALTEVNEKSVNGALSFIDDFDAKGGTNINDALKSALRMFTGSGRPGMVVFLTDGEPTVGETGMKSILKNIEGANKTGARIFVFGVGYDVNSHLLDKIAETHRGLSEYVVPDENIEVKVSSFFSKISEPVLAETALNFGKIKTGEIYPLIMPDIFKGTQLVLLGRYKNDGASAITLKGHVNGREQKFVYEGRFPDNDIENDFIPRIWASRKIGYLLSEVRLNGENRELIDEIVRLSKKYGIMTPYTSLLILEEETDYEEWGIRAEEAPAMKAEGERYKKAMESTSGGGAVSSAMDIMALKDTETADSPGLETVKHVGDKTFYLRNGVWVDSNYKKGTRVKDIKYLSKKYFDLLKIKPELGRYFAAAKNIMIVIDSKCYRITE